MKWFVAASAVLLLAGCQQTAATRNISPVSVTPEGKPIRLNFFVSLNADCTSRGYPEVRIVQQPANGTAVISRTNENPHGFRPGTQHYHCNARKVPGTKVVYTPRRGFVGQETVIVEGFYPTGTADRITHTINVR